MSRFNFVRRPAVTPPLRHPGSRTGFTLVELLTVMAIIGILMGILVPTVGMMRVQARKTKSIANLSSIGKGLLAYSISNNGLLPAPTFGESSVPSGSPGSANPRQGTWLEELAPYLECQYTSTPGSLKIILLKADVLTDPQYLAENVVISDPDVRGYGMNDCPFLPDPKNQTGELPTQRQAYQQLPNPSNNMVISTSSTTLVLPGAEGKFEGNNDGQSRYNGFGLYLFLDGSVQAMTQPEAMKILAKKSTI